jgi:hypothetical protein
MEIAVRHQARVEPSPRVGGALLRVDAVRLSNGARHLLNVCHQEPRLPRCDQLRRGPAGKGDDRGSARHRLRHVEAERLVPLQRGQERGCAGQEAGLLLPGDVAQVGHPVTVDRWGDVALVILETLGRRLDLSG